MENILPFVSNLPQIILGALFVWYGYIKLTYGQNQATSIFTNIGFAYAKYLGRALGTIEIIAGLFLILNIFVFQTALFLATLMFIATILKLFKPDILKSDWDFYLLLTLLLLIIATVL